MSDCKKRRSEESFPLPRSHQAEGQRGADEKLIFFVHPKSAGRVLVEFCQRAPEPLEPTFAPFRDGRLAYYVGGPEDAPPLVVLHGALGSTELETRRLLPTFQQHFKTFAVDFAAHGRSDDFPTAPPDFQPIAPLKG